METETTLFNQDQQQQTPAVFKPVDLAPITNINQTLAAIKQRVDRGMLALSKITIIETDDQDKVANDLLVKCRTTIEGGKDKDGNKTKGIKEQRTEITSILDQMKKTLIEPENQLIAEGTRVKTLRDKWANDKLKKEEEAKKKAEEEKARQNAIAALKTAIRDNLTKKVFEKVNSLGATISAHVSTMTLENWDEKERTFNITPKLKEELYHECFQKLFYDAKLISEPVFNALIEEMKLEETYEKHNSLYVQYAQPVIEMWKKDLPERKEKLLKIKELEETNALAAATEKRRLAEDTEKQQQQQQHQLDQQQSQAADEVKTSHQEEQLQNEFQSQVTIQEATGTTAKGTAMKRVAVINCEPQKIVAVLSKVLFACYSNPKFKGHQKRDKQTGLPIVDPATGVPEYEKWCEELLDFVAKNVDSAIEGIEFKQVASTSSRK